MTQLDLFHNTINLKGSDLENAKIKVGTQNEKILTFFKDHPGESFTPFDVQNMLRLHGTPVTSIRRAMTTLTILNFLEKTERMRTGRYGMTNHTWRLKP